MTNNNGKTPAEKAIGYFREGYNCAQAVLSAFCDKTGMDIEQAKKIASSFGAGMGRLREVCGAVSGMFMVAGLFYGYSDPADRKAKTAHYTLIQEMAEEFIEENGSIICRELLNLDKKTSTPIPDKRTYEYYKKRPCVELVGCAADITQKYINKKSEEAKNDNSSSK